MITVIMLWSPRVQNDRKVAFCLSFRGFDNADLFGECVHTQIKRAYELSVCMSDRSYRIPTIALTGVPGARVRQTLAKQPAGLSTSDRRVQFSFHIVEIS
ncbi:hypothetical protein ACYU03_08850 [Pseudomonas sp. X10]